MTQGPERNRLASMTNALCVPPTSANPAGSPSTVVMGIEEIKGMTILAMCLGGIPSSKPYPSQGILPVRNWLKVVGIHAGPDTAEMIDLESCGDGAAQRLVGKAMGENFWTPVLCELDLTISGSLGPCPNPARCPIPERAVEVNLGPETLFYGDRLGMLIRHRDLLRLGVMRRAATTVPPPLFYHMQEVVDAKSK